MPSPSLADPDEQISRIRFLTCQFRSRGLQFMNDPGRRQRIPSEDASICSQVNHPFWPRRASHRFQVKMTRFRNHRMRLLLPVRP